MFPTADPNASAGALSSLFGDDSDDDDSALAYQRKKAPSSLGARDGAKLQAAVAAAPEQVSGSAAFQESALASPFGAHPFIRTCFLCRFVHPPLPPPPSPP